MHTRQGVAEPAQPNHSPAHEIDKLPELLAPNWAPLEKLCPPGICEQFMFMGCDRGVYLYKHVDSRRYLNVDALGATYAFNPRTSSYDPIPIAAAMRTLAQEELEDIFSPSERTAIMVMMSTAQVQR